MNSTTAKWVPLSFVPLTCLSNTYAVYTEYPRASENFNRCYIDGMAYSCRRAVISRSIILMVDRNRECASSQDQCRGFDSQRLHPSNQHRRCFG
jgi:hypothetical protein